ncbi:hypothetical protein PoB_001126900, partial [Plakobranchus ocellatus]
NIPNAFWYSLLTLLIPSPAPSKTVTNNLYLVSSAPSNPQIFPHRSHSYPHYPLDIPIFYPHPPSHTTTALPRHTCNSARYWSIDRIKTTPKPLIGGCGGHAPL